MKAPMRNAAANDALAPDGVFERMTNHADSLT